MGETRALCDDGWTDINSERACFELYGSKDVIYYSTGVQCHYTTFWLDDVDCLGTETKIQ